VACPNPFTANDLQLLNQQLKTNAETLELAQKCKACGLMTEGYESQLENIQQTLRLIKQHFFPSEN